MYELDSKQVTARRKAVFLRFVCLIPAVLLLLLTFLLIFAAVLSIILLTSAGLLALPVSVGILAGILTNVATDLAPPAMAFAGGCCLFASVALVCLLLIFFPKIVIKFSRLTEWFFLFGE